MDDERKKQDLVITPYDFLSLVKRSQKKLLASVFIFTLLFFLLALIKPLTYSFTATFREKGESDSQLNTSLASILTGFSKNSGSEAESLMTSKKLLASIIQKLDLQAVIEEVGEEPSFLSKTATKFATEWAYLTRKKYYIPKDNSPSRIDIIDIKFNGEAPKNFHIEFLSHRAFTLTDLEDQTTMQGEIESPIRFKGTTFTAVSSTKDELTGRNFTLSLIPLAEVAKNITDQLTLDQGSTSPQIIELSLVYPDRMLGATLLNHLMYNYQEFLQKEQQVIAKKQIAYLQKRERETSSKLEQNLKRYAKTLSTKALESGFPDTELALDYLSTNYAKSLEQSHHVDLAIKRHEIAKHGNVGMIKYESDPDFNKQLENILQLRQQRDSIELALRTSKNDAAQDSESFLEEQLKNLHQVKTYREETKLLLQAFQEGEVPVNWENFELSQEKDFLIRNWMHRLSKGESKKEFLTYLKRLYHYFDVYQKTINQQLSHLRKPLNEFQGITLETAKKLYIEYTIALSNVEKLQNELQFIVEKLENPEFEITSLITLEQDPVVLESAKKAREITLALKDEANHSFKEQERLKGTLEIHRKFLSSYFVQKMQTNSLEERLLNKKINGLRNAYLQLLEQEIAILENQVNQGMMANLKSLQYEKEFLINDQQILLDELAKIPDQWIAEQMIKNEAELYKRTVEEVTKLVESANISYNLKIMQSSPLDTATPPPLPNSPKLLLYTLIGAALGSFAGLSVIFLTAVFNGVRVSENNLRYLGVNVIGTIGNQVKSNTAPLKRLLNLICPYGNPELPSGKTLFMTQESHHPLKEQLAHLLAGRGFKVLLFDTDTEAEELPTLEKYLYDESEQLPITEGAQFDTFHTQVKDSKLIDLIGTAQFQQLKEELKQKYDWIVIQENISPLSPECEGLIPLFDHTVIGLKEETVDEILPLAEKKNISFYLRISSYP